MNSTNVFLTGIQTYLILYNVNIPIAIIVFIHDMKNWAWISLQEHDLKCNKLKHSYENEKSI